MSWRATGVMWIIAIGFGLLAWLAGAFDARESAASGPNLLHPPGTFPVEEVTEVSIARAGEEPLVFARSAGGWKQVAPFQIDADGFAVRQFLNAVADLSWSRRFQASQLEGGATLEQLGLDPPLATVLLSVSDRVERIDIGRRTVAGRGWIRHGADGEVMVVQDTLHERGLEDDLRNWRSRNLVARSENDEIDAIEIFNGDLRTQLLRDGRTWTMTAPVKTRADGEGL